MIQHWYNRREGGREDGHLGREDTADLTSNPLHPSPERVLHVVAADAVGVPARQHKADDSISALPQPVSAVVNGHPCSSVLVVRRDKATVMPD